MPVQAFVNDLKSPQIIALAMSVLCVACVPLWLVEIPPLVDYPNHMARMHILVNVERSAWLSQYYEIRWAVLPNLAMDLVIPVLAKVMPLETAGKVFIALTFSLLFGGVIALHAALHRRWSLWPLLAVLFLYNSVLLWGFLNYLFGLGMALCTFAGWVTFRSTPHRWTIPFFSVCAALIFLSHLFAFGFYIMVVVAYELGQYYKERREGRRAWEMTWPKAAAQFALPVVLFALSATIDSRPENLPSWLRYAENPHGVRFGRLATKVEAFKGTLRTFNPVLDKATVIILLALVGMGLIARRLSLASTMYWPLAIVGVATFVMPASIFTGTFVEMRLPIALVLLSIASSDMRVKERRWILTIVMILGVVFIVRMAQISFHWQEAERKYSEYLQAIEKLPVGARLFSAVTYPNYRDPLPIPMDQLACWAVIKKSAFVSTIFAFPTQQPLALTAPYRRVLTIDAVFDRHFPVPWNIIAMQYEYLLVVREQFFDQPLPSGFIPMYEGEDFRLYRIPRSAG
ncbi:MAG: hypothetical protein ACREJU_16650 [Nitrospiraceae bacterium]